MYICGLKDYICSELNLCNPNTIEDARHATRLIEQKSRFNKTSFIGSEKLSNYSKENLSNFFLERSNKYILSQLWEENNHYPNPEKKKEGK